jgi:hypothetical protein
MNTPTTSTNTSPLTPNDTITFSDEDLCVEIVEPASNTVVLPAYITDADWLTNGKNKQNFQKN